MPSQQATNLQHNRYDSKDSFSGRGGTFDNSNKNAQNQQYIGIVKKQENQPGTEKLKKNQRKISSGVPNKVVVGGRGGQNIVNPQYVQTMPPVEQYTDQSNRKTMMNYNTQKAGTDTNVLQQMRMSQDAFNNRGNSQTNLNINKKMAGGTANIRITNANGGGSRNMGLQPIG